MRAFRMYAAFAVLMLFFAAPISAAVENSSWGQIKAQLAGVANPVKPAGKAVVVDGSQAVTIMEALPNGKNGNGLTRIEGDGTLYIHLRIKDVFGALSAGRMSKTHFTVSVLPQGSAEPTVTTRHMSRALDGDGLYGLWYWGYFKATSANTTGSERQSTVVVRCMDDGRLMGSASVTLAQPAYAPSQAEPADQPAYVAPVSYQEAEQAFWEPEVDEAAAKAISAPAAGTCETCMSLQSDGSDDELPATIGTGGAGSASDGTTNMVSGSQGDGTGDHNSPEQSTPQPTLTNESMFVMGSVAVAPREVAPAPIRLEVSADESLIGSVVAINSDERVIVGSFIARAIGDDIVVQEFPFRVPVGSASPWVPDLYTEVAGEESYHSWTDRMTPGRVMYWGSSYVGSFRFPEGKDVRVFFRGMVRSIGGLPDITPGSIVQVDLVAGDGNAIGLTSRKQISTPSASGVPLVVVVPGKQEPEDGVEHSLPDNIHVGAGDEVELIYDNAIYPCMMGCAEGKGSPISTFTNWGIKGNHVVASVRLDRAGPYSAFVLHFIAADGDEFAVTNVDIYKSGMAFVFPYDGTPAQRAFVSLERISSGNRLKLYGILRAEHGAVAGEEVLPLRDVSASCSEGAPLVRWRNADILSLRSYSIYRSEVRGERGVRLIPATGNHGQLDPSDANAEMSYHDTSAVAGVEYFYTVYLHKFVEYEYSEKAPPITCGAPEEPAPESGDHPIFTEEELAPTTPPRADFDWLLPIYWPGKELPAWQIGQHLDATDGLDGDVPAKGFPGPVFFMEAEMPPPPPAGVRDFWFLVDGRRQARDFRSSNATGMEFVMKFVLGDFLDESLESLQLTWDPSKLPEDATGEVAFVLRNEAGEEVIHQTYVDIRDGKVTLSEDSYAMRQGMVMFIIRRNN